MNPLWDCHLRTHQTLRGHRRIFARACYLQPNNISHVASEELCAMLGKKVRDPLSLLHPSPAGTDCDRAATSLLSQLQQKKQERWEEAVNSIDFSHSNRKAWRTINKLQVWMLLSPVPRLGKLHCLATRKARGTQDQGWWVHQAGRQGAVQPMEDSNTWGSLYL